jgi:hypothetical protein
MYLQHFNLERVRIRSDLGWPPAPHWATFSFVALSTSASTGASDQLYVVLDSSKGKSTGSDHVLLYLQHFNLVWVQVRSDLGWPPAPHWAAFSFVALSTSASTGARGQLYFVWDSSKGGSTGSDHLLSNTRHYNLIWVRLRSDLGWPPAPHWAIISYVAWPTCTCTCGTSSNRFFVWDSTKGKPTGSYHHFILQQHRNPCMYLLRAYCLHFGVWLWL